MSQVLQKPTLVLNRSWLPVHVTTVYRAMAMLWSDTAQVICPDTYQLFTWADWITQEPKSDVAVIRTGRLKIAVPEVVRLGDFDRQPTHAVTFTRANLLKRDHHTCQYCHKQFSRDDLTIDHVLPRSRGGPNTWTNCVAACVPCNALKADRTPEQAGMKLKRRPVQPEWRPFWAAQGVRVKVWEQFISPKQQLGHQLSVRG